MAPPAPAPPARIDDWNRLQLVSNDLMDKLQDLPPQDQDVIKDFVRSRPATTSLMRKHVALLIGFAAWQNAAPEERGTLDLLKTDLVFHHLIDDRLIGENPVVRAYRTDPATATWRADDIVPALDSLAGGIKPPPTDIEHFKAMYDGREESARTKEKYASLLGGFDRWLAQDAQAEFADVSIIVNELRAGDFTESTAIAAHPTVDRYLSTSGIVKGQARATLNALTALVRTGPMPQRIIAVHEEDAPVLDVLKDEWMQILQRNSAAGYRAVLAHFSNWLREDPSRPTLAAVLAQVREDPTKIDTKDGICMAYACTLPTQRHARKNFLVAIRKAVTVGPATLSGDDRPPPA